uniref:Transcription factor grauzone n=1 Tax=Glossina brevipalpis TaxID=37001 RepID=A0A1A9WJ79_9MUSC
MICRLCLKEVNEYKNAFEVKSCKLTMASIIREHFWFEVQENDPISTVICDNCWLKVSDFHEFYKSIEEAQNYLGEKVVVKIEHIGEEHSIENVVIQPFPAQFSKQELEVDFNEVNDEVPFDIMTEGTKDNLNTDMRMEDFPDIERTQQSNNNYTALNVNKIVDYKTEKLNDHRQAFIKNEGKGRNELAKKKRTFKTSELSRITRSSSKIKLSVPLTQQTRCLKTVPAKVNKIERNNVTKEKTKKLPEQDKATREQDEEIAKFMSLHCELCKSPATNFNSLRNHMFAEHKINGYVRCCNKKFSKRSLLLDHIGQHTNPECFKCEPCKRVFANRRSLGTHMLTKHEKDEDKRFACSRCPQKFARMYLLKRHELVGHSHYKHADLAVDNEIARFTSLHCEVCNEEATNFTALKGHMRAEHSMNGYVRCCNKKFTERALLIEHIQTHLNPACYKCEECGLVFSERQSMRNHFLMKHPNIKDTPFACSQCSKKFVTVLLLQRHKAIAHGDHNNTCNSCCKRFNTASQLFAHIKEQSLCDTCAKVVCGAAALQRHLLQHRNNPAEIEKEECL